jgi:hypothetical protein
MCRLGKYRGVDNGLSGHLVDRRVLDGRDVPICVASSSAICTDREFRDATAGIPSCAT